MSSAGSALHLESVGGHDGQVRAVFTGQAGDGAFTGPAAEQDVERVVGAGGEDDVGPRHPGQRGDGRAAGVEHRRGGLGGDVSADLGFVPGVLGGRVDDREALPRARGAVEVQPGDLRAGPRASVRSAIGRHLVDSDSPKSPAGSVHQCVRRRPAAASSASTPSGRNLQDTSVSISSPAAKSTVRSSAAIRTRCALRGAQPHLDALLVGVPARDVLERVEVEIGVEFAIDHREHVAVEPRRYARTVVVGAHQPIDVLDQVGAQQQAVTGLQGVRQRRTGNRLAGRASGCRSSSRGTPPGGGRRAGSCRGAPRNHHTPHRSRRRGTPAGSPRPPR